MAVVTVKSGAITDRDAHLIAKGNIAQAMVREMAGYCAITSGNSVGSKYIFGTIPSNARPSQFLISAPDIGTTTAADFGLYKTTANGGAVVDADFFSAAVVLNAGALAESNILNGNVITVANSEKMIWELLGLSADPCTQYDVVATLTGAADASGGVAAKLKYAV